MRMGNLIFTGVGGLLLVAATIAMGADGSTRGGPTAWATPGTEWTVHVTQYSRGWALGINNPQKAKEAQKPRVQEEYHMTIGVRSVQESEGRMLVSLEFTPGADAPKHVANNRCVLTVEMDTLDVVHAECTMGAKAKRRKLLPWTVQAGETVYKPLFARVVGFPVDWAIKRADIDTSGVECFLARRPQNVGAKGHWERVRPTDLHQENPQTYRGEFRRKVTHAEDGQAIKVVVFQRDAFQDTPTDEVQQVWDPTVGWWRSFKRYRQGHIELEATLVDRKGE